MAQFNNQISIEIHKNYNWLEYIDTIKACRTLNGAAFKIYVYLSSYSNGDIVDFSPQKINQELNIGISTARNAFSELAREGYLKKIQEKLYSFSGEQKL